MVTTPGLLMWYVAWARELEIRREVDRHRVIREWERERAACRTMSKVAADDIGPARREGRAISPTEV
ncbi:MAG: hypothetical protein ACT4OI_05270 [Methanobacteriota archaeon]